MDMRVDHPCVCPSMAIGQKAAVSGVMRSFF